ncbi:MAG: hypothetical protein KGJ86_08775, partial [Chloroflexota bacterium]|nr:hypothetical protein [Chloroflexota bacterium]
MTAEPVGQVVDTASAREFMREALEQIEEDELLAIAGEAERKSAGFRRLLSAAAIEHLAPDGQRRILRSVFATRRKAAAVAESTGPEQFRSLAAGLLYGPGPIADRFDSFCRALPEADGYLAWDLGSELLHYTQPEAYWLWNRWLW